VAVAACEQCGRNRVPVVHDAVDLAAWVRAHGQPSDTAAHADHPVPLRLLLSLREGTRPLLQAATGTAPVWFLSGPEGGLSAAEEALAVQHGFAPTTLGPRVLRAETAPLAALAALTLV
jgi:16S rRNA (uracil1498-N3)-methyltransferase